MAVVSAHGSAAEQTLPEPPGLTYSTLAAAARPSVPKNDTTAANAATVTIHRRAGTRHRARDRSAIARLIGRATGSCSARSRLQGGPLLRSGWEDAPVDWTGALIPSLTACWCSSRC